MEKDVYEVGYRVAVREPEHLRSYPFYGRIPVAICSSASCGNRAGALSVGALKGATHERFKRGHLLIF